MTTTITGTRREKIAEIERKIEEEMAWIREKRDELEKMLELVDNVPPAVLEQMSRSASGATQTPEQGDTAPIDESAETTQDFIQKLEESIEAKQKLLDELRTEREALENFEKGV